MKFKNAAAVESVIWQLRLSDFPRAENRARINELFNGFPPYSDSEVRDNSIEVNVNNLEGTNLATKARGQLSNALVSPDPIVNIQLDYGPVYKKYEWGDTITSIINRILKNSREFNEEEESTLAQIVLHGIGPAHWENRYCWCPESRGVEDVLVPSETLRSLKNLPLIAIYRSYTWPELYKLTHGPKVDRAWNMPVVEQCLAWVDQEASRLFGTKWPEFWSPEKMSERIKQDTGIYMSDAVPTIDTFEVLYWDDDGKKAGWKRRIILDAWGDPGVGGAGGVANYPGRADYTKYGLNKSEFLFDSGDRIYCSKLDEAMHFQFGDCSPVGPFKYHSVRSIGFLNYAVLHLQNRLNCRFHDHVFENLIQYFRVANPADAERLMKIDLYNRGVIPEGLTFVPQGDRWQINERVLEMAFQTNRQTIADNSSGFVQDFDFKKENAEETATRTMAKVSSTAAMIGAMLQRAYNYQKFKYMEICRRFCIEDSRDPDVKRFRVECFRAGIPKEALNVERWDINPVRVIGQGNHMLQVAMMDKVMAVDYPRADARAQKDMTRMHIAVNTGDWQLARRWVPDTPVVDPAVNFAENDAANIMLGMRSTPRDGINHVAYIESQIRCLAEQVQIGQQQGSMVDEKTLRGMLGLVANINAHIQKLAQDKAQKMRVRKYSDDLGKLTNFIKAFAQRLKEQKQAQAKVGPQIDPETQAKVQGTILVAKTKAEIAAQNHARKTAEQQLKFEQQLKQDAAQKRLQLTTDAAKAQIDITKHRMNSFRE